MRRSAIIGGVCIAFLVIITNLQGAWIENVPNQLTQPDGTVVDVLYSGDEFHNWPHDANGFTMIIDEHTGYVCWAVAKGGNLVSTGKEVHLFTPQELGLSPRQNISPDVYKLQRQQWNTPTHRSPTRTPTTGVVQDLVIFIRFFDDPEFNVQVARYDSLFNTEGYGVNSLIQYYWDASYNQLRVESPFYPIPYGNTIVSYQDDYPRGYYQPYNVVSNPIGWTGGNNGWERGIREQQLLQRAIQYVENEIPTSLLIDGDYDGIVDNVNFVVRGSAGAWASLLWPHKWTMGYYADAYIHGKMLGDYNFNIENHMTTSGVSVLAHEFGHSLGAPDFYRYEYNGTPVGPWCLMAHDLNPPQSMTAYTKYYYMHWVPEIPLATQSGVYTLHPNSLNQYNHAIKVPSPNSNSEYFVVEYRNKTTGITDSMIAGSGLVIWRINGDIAGWGNADGPPDEMYVFRAGGTPDSEGNIASAFFSADNGITAIHDLSTPYTFLSNGQRGGLTIYDIGSASETISFYLDVDGADPQDIDETFESQTFATNDWQNDTAHPWTITNAQAHDGSYSASSPTLIAGQSARLEIDLNTSRGYMQFYGRTNTIQNGDFLSLYVNNNQIQQWSGNTNWFYYSMFLETGIYNIAWVFEKNSTNTNGTDRVWIDQIGFPNIAGAILYPAKNLSIQAVERDITLNWVPPFTTTLPNPPTLIGYKVIRNGVSITTEPITQTTFQYFTTGGYSQSYWVVAEYDTGVSAPSNAVPHAISYIPASNLQATSEENGVRLTWEYNYPLTFVSGFRITRDGTIINLPTIDEPVLTYLDTTIPTTGTYTYVVRVLYTSPSGVSLPTNEVSIYHVSEEDFIEPIMLTQLKNNYPNPFNPQTSIHFTIANDTTVKLNVYNIKGQLVTTLLNKRLLKGEHTTVWNGKDQLGNAVSSGVYFYKMDTESYSSLKKMVLLK